MVEIWLVVTEVAVFGAANLGVFLYKFGALEARVVANEDWIRRADAKVDGLMEDVAELRGEAKAWQTS